MLLGHSGLRTEEVSDHHHCRFGKWYYSEGKAQYGHLDSFRAIEAPHGKVHTIAKEAVTLFNAQRKQEAKQKVDALNGPTAEVLALLDKLRDEARRG
jgi:methyl-accepting chemotaxis protein